MPVEGAYQYKLQQVNQEENQLKKTYQLKIPFTHAEPTRVPNNKAYSEKLQQENPLKKLIIQPSKKLAVTPRNRKNVKNEN